MMNSYESKQRQYWDAMAIGFADNPVAAVHWFDDDSVASSLMFDEIAAYISKKANLTGSSSVLVIGCGNGLILKSLAKYVAPTISFYGIDISPELLKQVDLPNCHVDCAEASEIPHPNNKFQLVFLHSVVQYFSSLEYLDAVMEEIKRVLVPGGICVILDIPNHLFESDMHSKSLVRDILKKLLGYRLYEFVKLAKARLSQKKSMKKDACKTVPEYSLKGLFVAPDFFLKYFQSFNNCALELQPYQAKPLIYRKYRFNFVGIGLIK